MSKQEIEDNELFTVDEVGDHGVKQEETSTEVKPTKKTKKQKEDEIRSHKTLFVRNVPQTAKDAEFEQFFEKFGPLKTCFLVRKPTDKLCKGFGFVNL
jgi:RNA recognition motif-containing protein